MSDIKQKAFSRLRELRQEADTIFTQGTETDAFKVWKRSVRTALVKLFGQDSPTVRDFDKVSYFPVVIASGTSDSVYRRAFASGMRSAIAIIDASIQEVEDYGLESLSTDSRTLSGVPLTTNGVFIVHGRDNGAKETVARFLEKLELNPIILHEQPDVGQTIVEKFERNADVGFAVVILTPDDVGALASASEDLQPRARQNVVFELGYFVGKIGRSRVCAMVRGKVEIPTDYLGIVYIQLEGDEWKLRLVKELKEAGFDVDANKAL